MSTFVYVGWVGGQCNVYIDFLSFYISKESINVTNLMLILKLMSLYLMNFTLMYYEIQRPSKKTLQKSVDLKKKANRAKLKTYTVTFF